MALNSSLVRCSMSDHLVPNNLDGVTSYQYHRIVSISSEDRIHLFVASFTDLKLMFVVCLYTSLLIAQAEDRPWGVGWLFYILKVDISSVGPCHQCPEQASATMIKRGENLNGINQNTTTLQEIALIIGLARYDKRSDSFAIFFSLSNSPYLLKSNELNWLLSAGYIIHYAVLISRLNGSGRNSLFVKRP